MPPYEILQSEIEHLLEKTREYRQSAEYSSFFKTLVFIKQSRYLAPFNALLVMQQRPDASFVLSEDRWRGLHKRAPRPGVQPIVIMKPFGPVEFVYDIKDIEGIEANPIPGYNPNLPTEEICRRLFPVEGDIRGIKGLFEEMVRTCRKLGLSFQEAPLEISHAGQVRLTEARYLTPRKEVGTANRLINYIIQVNSTHPVEIRFAALIHELAHIFCRHLNEFNSSGYKGKERHEEEFEAEAVSYLFCYRYGFRPRSEQYLAGYLKEGCEPSLASFDVILGALKKIEDLLKPEENAAPPQSFSFSLVNHHSWMTYSIKLNGNSIIYELEGPEGPDEEPSKKEEIILTQAAWSKFWQACNSIGIWSWERTYLAPQVDCKCDWSLSITLADREIVSSGHNAFPGEEHYPEYAGYSLPFRRFLKAVSKLAGGLPLE